MTFDLVFFAAMVPAVILIGLAKGGFSGLGLLSLPLMALVVSPVTAAAIMLPLLIVQDVVSVWSYRREFDRRNLATLAARRAARRPRRLSAGGEGLGCGRRASPSG